MKAVKTEIYNNMNETGGGLAVNITGRYESNRKALADLDESKRTAGEVAKSLRKSGYKITATQIKQFCEEWHHAGFIPKRGMARTFYTKKSDDEILNEIQIYNDEITRKQNSIITGFYYIWDYDYNGRYGKKRNYKVCKFYEGNENNIPRNFTSCSRNEFESSDLYEGKKFYGWDEPSL